MYEPYEEGQTPYSKGGAENNSLLKERHGFLVKEKVDLMLATPLTGAQNWDNRPHAAYCW